jgi:cytoskeletal protein CcmA (bactofilin family)
MGNVDGLRERAPASAASESGASLDERRMRAWIGRALVVQGKVISSEDLTIDGRVDGSIELGDHSLTIGPDATIRADLVAQRIVISGAVTGNVLARAIVDLRATGSVDGDIFTPRLVMADGATIRGRVEANVKVASTPPR